MLRAGTMSIPLERSDTYHRWERAILKCHWTALELMRVWDREASKGRKRRH
jgi:hypothetical protein